MTSISDLPKTRDEAIAIGAEFYIKFRPSKAIQKIALSKRIALAHNEIHHYDNGILCEVDSSHGAIKQASTGRCVICEGKRLAARQQEMKAVELHLYNLERQKKLDAKTTTEPVVEEPTKLELDFIELNVTFDEHEKKLVPRIGQTWEVDNTFKTWVIEYDKFDTMLLPYVRWNPTHYTDSTTLREHFKYNEADVVNGLQCKSAEMNGVRYFWIRRELITPLAANFRFVRAITSPVAEKVISVPSYLPDNLIKQYLEHNPSIMMKDNIDELTFTFDDLIIESL